MGVVHSATRLSDGAPVAVKLLRDDLAASENYRRRLRAEAELAARLDHPGVVRTIEFGESADAVWLVLELVEGTDLQRLIAERGPLAADKAAGLIADAADTVAAVHAAGLVHRDLKPANILLQSPTGADAAELGWDRVRVADFGVAAPVATVDSTIGGPVSSSLVFSSAPSQPDSSQPDSTGGAFDLGTGAAESEMSSRRGNSLAGTVAYMAPEQWRGEECGVAADVYGLGGTLYTALTGHRPFPQHSLTELAYAVALTPAPAPSERGAPAAFDPVVATAMAKDAEHRYPGAAEFADAVRAAARGERLPAPVAATKRTFRPRWIVAAVVALAVVIGGGALITALNSGGGTAATRVDRMVCAKHNLSLRDHPGGGGIRRQLDRGTHVVVQRDRDAGAYSYVDLDDGDHGWVLNEYLRESCR